MGRKLSKVRREEILRFLQMKIIVAESHSMNALCSPIEFRQSEAKYIISLIEKDLEDASKKD